jgi:hypothetical protein
MDFGLCKNLRSGGGAFILWWRLDCEEGSIGNGFARLEYFINVAGFGLWRTMKYVQNDDDKIKVRLVDSKFDFGKRYFWEIYCDYVIIN